MPEAALSEESIIAIVRDTTKFAAKIDELAKAKAGYEAAEKAARIEQANLAKERADTDSYVAGKKAELAASKNQHDIAAKEAADRMTVNNAQMAEILRVKKEVDAKVADVDRREQALTVAEKVLSAREARMAALVNQVAKDRDLLERQRAYLAQLPTV